MSHVGIFERHTSQISPQDIVWLHCLLAKSIMSDSIQIYNFSAFLCYSSLDIAHDFEFLRSRFVLIFSSIGKLGHHNNWLKQFDGLELMFVDSSKFWALFQDSLLSQKFTTNCFLFRFRTVHLMVIIQWSLDFF